MIAPILGYSSSHALGSRLRVLSYNINREWRMKQDTKVGYGSKQKRIMNLISWFFFTNVEHGNHRQNRNFECLQTSLYKAKLDTTDHQWFVNWLILSIVQVRQLKCRRLASHEINADSGRATCNSCATSYVECLAINPNAVKKVDNWHGG